MTTPTPAEEHAPRRRGRPRSRACEDAILQATAQLLEERGYAALTIEGVAERAGVGKQTIYKWWEGKARLCMDAYVRQTEQRMPEPDTGDLEQDLIALLTMVCHALAHSNFGATVAGVMTEAQSNPGLAHEFRETFIKRRREVMVRILRRGITRGQVRADLNIPCVLDLVYGALWMRLLLQHAPLDARFARELVETMLPALRSRPA